MPKYVEDILIFSQSDWILFHRMNIKCSIFKSGGNHQWKYKFLGLMSEIKFDLTLNKKGYNMPKHVIMGGS